MTNLRIIALHHCSALHPELSLQSKLIKTFVVQLPDWTMICLAFSVVAVFSTLLISISYFVLYLYVLIMCMFFFSLSDSRFDQIFHCLYFVESRMRPAWYPWAWSKQGCNMWKQVVVTSATWILLNQSSLIHEITETLGKQTCKSYEEYRESIDLLFWALITKFDFIPTSPTPPLIMKNIEKPALYL